MKHLKNLLSSTPNFYVIGNPDVLIKGISANSKSVVPGDLFIAKKGLNSSGTKYIPEAIASGAVAILTDLYDSNYSNITQIIAQDILLAERLVTTAFYDSPADKMFMVGVTGTNGKTTTAYLIKYLLDTLRGPCGLIGTVEYNIGNRSIPAQHTTPDVTTNNKLLHQMTKNTCQSAVMEVSSHALTQGRVSGINYDVSVYTNLSQDHLDYHTTMESYASAKNLLFRHMSPKQKDDQRRKAVVVNMDDAFVSAILDGCEVPKFTYGLQEGADLSATDIKLEGGSTSFKLIYLDQSYACRIPLIGRYNVYNTLAALGVALTQGFSIERLIKLCSLFPSIPGRMEMVKNSKNLRIVVDFAHTEDALENALKCIREMKPKRLITVFGCGGDRDRGKRPKMGMVSGKRSDISIVTSDNPRTEDPLSIISEIAEGFEENQNYIIEPDRKKAINMAIELATPEDVILIAGKGHETTQVISHRSIEFDDRKVAQEFLGELN